MPKKYHVAVSPVSPRFLPIGKYATVEVREECAGSCRNCVKKNCIYEIFDQERAYLQKVASPDYLYSCYGCFRCVQECTKGIFSRVINPAYRALGDAYWTPEIVSRLWYQAETGKIPVSGAGYRGPFVGPGFDSMWTDMSEIVRPTRDGIHGREYINTSIDLGRRPRRLAFNAAGELAEVLPIFAESPLPMLLNYPSFGAVGPKTRLAMAAAAKKLGAYMFIRAEDLAKELLPYASYLIPSFSYWSEGQNDEFLKGASLAELTESPEALTTAARMKAYYPELIIALRLPLTPEAEAKAVKLTTDGAEVLHFVADDKGRELNSSSPRFVKDALRAIHTALVKNGLRDEVTILASGGIAMAEHTAKAIICGADGVGVDLPLLTALECRLCRRCVQGLSCPVELADVPLAWGSQRIVNLIAAWRGQLIEVLGAMGIREVRRLRGEMGRAMLFEDLERDSFGPLFGERKIGLPQVAQEDL